VSHDLETRRILVISDGRRGHLNQSLTVARRLGEPVALEITLPRWKAVLVNLVAWGTLPFGRIICGYIGLALGLPVADARKSGASAVVSTGQTVAGSALLLKKVLGLPVVVLMKPTAMPLSAFDAVVAPVHDFEGQDAERPNVILVPVALSEPLAGAASLRSEALPEARPAAALLVGGETHGISPREKEVTDALDTLIRWATTSRGRVLLTTSRRTPGGLSAKLKDITRQYANLTEAVFADETELNPVGEYLARARFVIVTDDSFSMASEAVLSGRTPFILETGVRRKFQRTYQEWVRRGYARMGSRERLEEYLAGEYGESGPRRILEDALTAVKRRLGWR
jgi:mitochondrial fission protein ELM1